MNHYDSYKKFKKKIIVKYKQKSKKSNSKTTKISRRTSKKLNLNSNEKKVHMSSKKNNLDKFISINDFLAEEMSKGPIEEKGTIDYHYQSYTNIFNFFTILVNHYHFNKILCIPKFVLKFKSYIDITSIVYYVDKNEFIIPTELKNKFKNCSKSRIRFIYCTFMIDNSHNKGINHANILIFDLYKNTIERFEPYGHLQESNEIKINQAIKTRLIKILQLENFEYLSPFDISPVIGPQQKADAYDGMCVSFCMLYLQLRLMNPDTIQTELIEYLSKKKHKDLQKLILRYAKFVELTLKKYQSVVYKNDRYVSKKNNSQQQYLISRSDSESYVEYGTQ
jgi:hypothetical protein